MPRPGWSGVGWVVRAAVWSDVDGVVVCALMWRGRGFDTRLAPLAATQPPGGRWQCSGLFTGWAFAVSRGSSTGPVFAVCVPTAGVVVVSIRDSLRSPLLNHREGAGWQGSPLVE
ncbi:hypothetical protein GCM10009624_35760 [Gordonia sinesedis]